MRGTGITTKQMKEAPQDAVYIWANSDLHYPKRLAHELGRDDLKIERPSCLEDERFFRGWHPSAVVLDHAMELNGKRQRGIDELVYSNVAII